MKSRARSPLRSINVSEGVVPLSEFKAQATRLLRELGQRDDPILITQNGKPVAVLLSPVQFEDIKERQEYLEAIAQGVEDADAGRVTTHKDVSAWLQSWGTDKETKRPR